MYKVMNRVERDELLVSTYKEQAKKGNQNRIVRINELRRITAKIESKDGEIVKLKEIIALMVNSLEDVKDRNSFGYIEVANLLNLAIRHVRSS